MCNCIERVQEKIRKKTGDELAVLRSVISVRGNKLCSMPSIEILYHKTKKDGTKSKTVSSMDLTYSYCPFCGQPLYDNQDEK